MINFSATVEKMNRRSFVQAVLATAAGAGENPPWGTGAYRLAASEVARRI